MLVLSPYSYSARKILKDRFQQPSDRDRSVNSCVFGGMGLQGKGEIWTAAQKRKRISPFPCTITVEPWRGWSWVTGGPGVGKAEGHGTTNVEMVADEDFCWQPNNGN